MERNQRQAADETWERPRYGNNSAGGPPGFAQAGPQYPPPRPAPRYGETHPPAFLPDGGAPRPAPWESRPPYEAGPHTDSRGEFRYHGAAPGLPPFRPQFPHVGPRPGLPLHGRTQEPVPQPGLPLLPQYGRDPLQPPASDGSGPVIAEAAMQYNAAQHIGSQKLERHIHQPGERQHAGPQHITEGCPDPNYRREHPDAYQPGERQHAGPQHITEGCPDPHYRRKHPDTYQPGEHPHVGPQHITEGCPDPHYRWKHPDTYQPGGPQHVPEGCQDHHYRREPPNAYQHGDPQHIPEDCQEHHYRREHPDAYQHGGPQDPNYRHQLIPEECRDPHYRREHPDAFQPGFFHQGGPAIHPHTSSSRQPAALHPDLPLGRSHLQPPAQPCMYQAGLQSAPPAPDPFTCPSISTQPAPSYSDNSQQGHYHQGHLPNPPYTVHPVPVPVFSGERDVEVPGPQRHHLQHLEQQPSVMHQDIRQGLDPGVTGAHLQHEEPERHRELGVLLQHGGPLVAQPMPHIENHFMQTDLEPGRPADKDVFVQWLSSFLSSRRMKPLVKRDAVQTYSIAEARGMIYGALRLVSQLDSLCQALESGDKAEEAWTQDYEKAASLRAELEKRLKVLEKPGYIQGVKEKLERVRKKRLRRRQGAEEEEKAAERSAEKEANIDRWRMQCIQKVEEKKRERELKATADHVLGEVRKKQNDVKKMLDVLKALEKLRKLRKEAAGRKGVCPPPSADETFTNHIKRLRTMVHSRSALYDAEEKTLRVILEGEQEEERQREKDKRLRKEKEKTLQKQRELDAILFGDTEPLPGLHPLQPFRQYYLQAEHSVVSLVQIRHEWDQFLVPPDHPDGSNIPRGWVVPTSPSNETWATALMPSD